MTATMKNACACLGFAWLIGTAILGNLELFNRWIISDVMRPTIARVSIDPGTEAYSDRDILQIPEGRRFAEKGKK